MQLQLEHNIPRVAASLRKHAKQVPYATALALNATALSAQAYERSHILQVFDVRRRGWMSKQIKHKPRATKRKQWTKLSIDPPGGRSDVIGKFEKGGTKRSRKGVNVAVPVGPRSLTRRTTRYPNIASRYGPFRRVGNSLRGRKGTWMIEHGPDAGLYQTVGGGHKWSKRGRSGARVATGRRKTRVRLLYAFVKSVQIDRRLDFVSNTTRTVKRVFPLEWSKAWRKAVRTAR